MTPKQHAETLMKMLHLTEEERNIVEDLKVMPTWDAMTLHIRRIGYRYNGTHTDILADIIRKLTK